MSFWRNSLAACKPSRICYQKTLRVRVLCVSGDLINHRHYFDVIQENDKLVFNIRETCSENKNHIATGRTLGQDPSSCNIIEL